MNRFRVVLEVFLVLKPIGDNERITNIAPNQPERQKNKSYNIKEKAPWGCFFVFVGSLLTFCPGAPEI